MLKKLFNLKKPAIYVIPFFAFTMVTGLNCFNSSNDKIGNSSNTDSFLFPVANASIAVKDKDGNKVGYLVSINEDSLIILNKEKSKLIQYNNSSNTSLIAGGFPCGDSFEEPCRFTSPGKPASSYSIRTETLYYDPSIDKSCNTKIYVRAREGIEHQVFKFVTGNYGVIVPGTLKSFIPKTKYIGDEVGISCPSNNEGENNVISCQTGPCIEARENDASYAFSEFYKMEDEKYMASYGNFYEIRTVTFDENPPDSLGPLSFENE